MSVVHRVGLLVWGVTAALWLVLTVTAARRERVLRRRGAVVLGVVRSPVRRWRSGSGSGLRPVLGRLVRSAGMRGPAVVAGVGCAGYVLVGGGAGVLVGVVAGVGAWWLRRGRGRDPEAGFDAADAGRQLPLAADLLAACVAAGAGPVVAAQAVGESLEGPVGDRLARGAAEVRLGGEPAEAWRWLGEIPGAGPLARHLERAGASGAPAAGPVARLAADCRAERGRAATAGARRAAVLMTAPVGLCFLPAFIAVGVLPVVIGLAGGVLGGMTGG
ncbi:type II secretion system F family protein [Actinomycetota bacterium Odt1-20B]